MTSRTRYAYTRPLRDASRTEIHAMYLHHARALLATIDAASKRTPSCPAPHPKARRTVLVCRKHELRLECIEEFDGGAT